MAGTRQGAVGRQRRVGLAQGHCVPPDGARAGEPGPRSGGRGHAAAEPGHQPASGRGAAALHFAAPAAMQMAGDRALGAAEPQGSADRHLVAVAGQPGRRSGVPARQGLSLRQDRSWPAQAGQGGCLAEPAGSIPASHRLCVVGFARARRRFRHDRRDGDARPQEFRGFRLLLRDQPHRCDPAAHHAGRRPLARHQSAQRRSGRRQDRGGRHRHSGRPQRLHQGCAHQGVRAPSGADRGELVRLPRHDGDAVSPLHHRRSHHHPAGERDLLLGKGLAAAVLPAQRPQARRRRQAPDARRSRAPGKRVRLLLAQRHAEDHGAGVRALDENPEPRAGQRALAARGVQGGQRAAAARPPSRAACRRIG